HVCFVWHWLCAHLALRSFPTRRSSDLRRARRGCHRRLEGGDLARHKRTAADLGAWLCFEDESGQGVRPPKGRTWGRRGHTPVVKDRKSTRLNSSHVSLSYAVFRLKKRY